MCGIVGILTPDNAQQKLIEQLYKLEYRGYDSAGVAIIEDKKILINKQIGSIDKLQKSTEFKPQSTCGIGHTRWATHGKPTVKNCHPHISQNKKWAIVHNGIVENYAEIKKQLQSKGVNLSSSTDSEVICNLLELNKKADVFNLIEVCKSLTGSYALACVCSESPDELFLAKYNSPLFVSVCGDDILVSSDIVSFMGKSNSFYNMHNGEFAHIKKNNIVFYDNTGKIISKELIDLANKSSSADKENYTHFMIKEIFEIPHLLQGVKNYYLKNKELISDFKKLLNNCDNIHFIGCGTAYHSGLVAQHYFRKLTSKNICSHISSEFVFGNVYLKQNDLCIFISQSGETADTLAAFRVAKVSGALNAALTNNINSQLAFLSDYTWPVLAGAEIAVASTKAYACQVLVLMMLIYLAMGNKFNFEAEIEVLATQIQNLNILEIKQLAKVVEKAKSVFFIGRGVDYITCEEASLKLKEISYINSVAISAGELKHGTLALVDDGSVIINVISQEATKTKGINSLHEVKARGAKVIVVSPFEEIREMCGQGDMFIKLQKTNEDLMPLLSMVPLQLLAYFVSTNKGINPDKPRNLAKSVTVE